MESRRSRVAIWETSFASMPKLETVNEMEIVECGGSVWVLHHEAS